MCPNRTEPVGKVGQVFTQSQQHTLMSIDNNLSLFDFRPNSLLERRHHCLKLTKNEEKEADVFSPNLVWKLCIVDDISTHNDDFLLLNFWEDV